MRKIVFRNGLLAAVTVFAVAAMAPAAVTAQPARAQEQRDSAQQTAQQRQQEAQERVSQIRQEVEQRKATIKKEVCEPRQQQLTSVMPRLATGATAVKTVIDTIYTRVQGFYASGQLTVSNYDELKAKVDATKIDVDTSLQAVDSYQFKLDCDNPNVGEQLDWYRSAITEAKESLKGYRAALVELISALRAEAVENAETGTSNRSNESEVAPEGGENNGQ